MAVTQSTFTNATAAVHALHTQGAIAKFLTVNPTATAFRFTSMRFTPFSHTWHFETFDKGASSYLGESLTYTANRNKDLHGTTLFMYELPGLMNAQRVEDAAPTNSYTIAEVVHDDIYNRHYDASGSATSLTNEYRESLFELVAGTAGTDAHAFRRHSGQPHYCDGVAIAAVKSVEYQLGGQRMDRDDKYSLYTWLVLNSGSVGVPHKMMGLAESRGNNDLELKMDSMAFQVKYCPLIFSFCRAPSMAAPLISNIYNNLSVVAEFEEYQKLIKNYSGAGNSGGGTVNIVRNRAILTGAIGIDLATGLRAATGNSDVAAQTQFYTLKRKWEDTLPNSRVRGRNLMTSNKSGVSTAAAVSASDLAQTDFPVSVVSQVYFLGPQERYAFASNTHHQIIEACQRVSHDTTQVSSKTYRTDTIQNACSWMSVCPLYKPNLSVNEYFDFGGAWDHVRQRTFPAVTTLEFKTNGSAIYTEADESFFTLVQPWAHHSNVLTGQRRVYAMNFGLKANSRGAVQAIGSLNLSRSVNSEVNAKFATNLWAAATGETEITAIQQAARTGTNLTMKFNFRNYNVLKYRSGTGGLIFTQSNNSN